LSFLLTTYCILFAYWFSLKERFQGKEPFVWRKRPTLVFGFDRALGCLYKKQSAWKEGVPECGMFLGSKGVSTRKKGGSDGF